MAQLALGLALPSGTARSVGIPSQAPASRLRSTALGGACARGRALRSARNARLAVQASAEVSPPLAAEAPGVLKQAAKDKGVAGAEVCRALAALERAARKGGLPPDAELLTGIGGTRSPGNVWRLVFTANGKVDETKASGSYFPITAAQRFDAEAMEVENGVFFGPLGYLIFKGPFSLQKGMLWFLYLTLSIKLGPLPEFSFDISSDETRGRTPGEGRAGAKDPFFSWFYLDDDVLAGRGRGGGTAFWTRSQKWFK